MLAEQSDRFLSFTLDLPRLTSLSLGKSCFNSSTEANCALELESLPQLTELSFPHHAFENYSQLRCAFLPRLERVAFLHYTFNGKGSNTLLDLSSCPSIKELSFVFSFAYFTSLNLTGLVALTSLSVHSSCFNGLSPSVFQLEGLTALITLSISANSFSSTTAFSFKGTSSSFS